MVEKSDLSSANNFAEDSKLSGRSCNCSWEILLCKINGISLGNTVMVSLRSQNDLIGLIFMHFIQSFDLFSVNIKVLSAGISWMTIFLYWSCFIFLMTPKT